MLSRQAVLQAVDAGTVHGTLEVALQVASLGLEEWVEFGRPEDLELFLNANEVVRQALDELSRRHYLHTGVDYGQAERSARGGW